MTKKNYQNGVAILFAILLVSIVLTVGLTLLNITLRQLILSSLARESQFAFYAADSARNCARYYDSLDEQDQRPFGYFGLDPNGDLEYFYDAASALLSLQCGETTSFSPGIPPGGQSPAIFSFRATFSDGAKVSCAEVTVTKYRESNAASPEKKLGKTKIESRGYNEGAEVPGTSCNRDSNTVERAATMVY